MRFLSFILFFCFLSLASAIRRSPAAGPRSAGLFPDPSHPIASADALILSDYLDAPSVAQSKSRVSIPGSYFADPLLNSRPSVDLGHAGYFTVNATTNSNLFFWFIPAMQANASATAPVIVWTNGGPGASSLYGMMEELGPYYSNANGTQLFTREITWNLNYNIIYLDNPVGTGWSFTDSDSGYSTNQAEAADNAYSFFIQFFTAFPQYQLNDLYLSGESYSGKWTSSFASKIDYMNKNTNPAIHLNLKGFSIGDGILAPEYQIPGYGQLLFNDGLLDIIQSNYFIQQEQQIVELLKNNQYIPAFRIFDSLLNGDFFPYPTTYFNYTGLTDYFNIRQPQYPANNWQYFINQPDIRAAIHVGNHVYWAQNSTVEFYLLNDWFHSNEAILGNLFENYRVLIYNGAFDVILSAAQCENFLDQFQWAGYKGWVEANKSVWKINSNDWAPAGYVKQSPEFDFTYVVVREAGHLLPQDQPKRAFDMITRFIDNLGWGN